MRGDGVGGGDIYEMHGCGWGSGDTAAGSDDDGACRQCDAGLDNGCRRNEFDKKAKPSGDGVGVSDGTRGVDGACDVHGEGTGGAHGMRGDGVGVGDIGEVPGVAWRTGDAAGSDYFWSSVLVRFGWI